MFGINKNKRSDPSYQNVIAVRGVDRGVGTTHISIMLSHYLGQHFGRTALIEWNGRQDFSEIEKAYTGFGFTADKEYFTIRRVTYYKNYNEQGLVPVKSGNYKWIVLDLGVRCHSFFDEADYAFVVGYGNEWGAVKTLTWKPSAGGNRRQNWKFLLNFGTEEEKRYLHKKTSQEIYCIPYQKDPFVINKGFVKILSKIICE